MGALDVGWMLRKAAQVSMQEMTWACDGETWTIFTSTTLKNMTKVFKLGEEFDEKTADMRDVTTLAVFEGGKLITLEKAKNSKHKSAKSTHEVVGDEIVLKMWVEGTEEPVPILKFKRVE